jgi:hypothetical protein
VDLLEYRRKEAAISRRAAVVVIACSLLLLAWLFAEVGATCRKRDPEMATVRNIVPKTLKCLLTDQEKLEFAAEVGRETQLHAAAKERKKEVMAQLTADVELHRTAVDRLGTLLANGYEYRTIDCLEVLDYELAVVRVTRTDTGEVCDIRPMTPSERQRELPLRPADQDQAPTEGDPEVELLAQARALLAANPETRVGDLQRELRINWTHANRLLETIAAEAQPAEGAGHE